MKERLKMLSGALMLVALFQVPIHCADPDPVTCQHSPFSYAEFGWACVG